MLENTNKSTLLLIAVNLVLFMIVFWLIGLIMGRDDTPFEQPVSSYSPPPAVISPPAPSAAQTAALAEPELATEADTRAEPGISTDAPTVADLMLSGSVQQAVNEPEDATPVAVEVPAAAAEPEMVETVKTINVYYDGELVRTEESDNHGNVHLQISNSLKAVDKIEPQDASYVAALNDLKQGRRQHVSMTEITREVATATVVATEPTADGGVDRFNKVDVSSETGEKKPVRRLTLAEQISTVVTGEQLKAPGDDAEYAGARLQDYV